MKKIILLKNIFDSGILRTILLTTVIFCLAFGGCQTPSAPVILSPSQIVVRTGDTIESIALHYGVSVEDLLIVNAFTQSPHLVVGQVLTIPQNPKKPIVCDTYKASDNTPTFQDKEWDFEPLPKENLLKKNKRSRKNLSFEEDDVPLEALPENNSISSYSLEPRQAHPFIEKDKRSRGPKTALRSDVDDEHKSDIFDDVEYMSNQDNRDVYTRNTPYTDSKKPRRRFAHDDEDLNDAWPQRTRQKKSTRSFDSDSTQADHDDDELLGTDDAPLIYKQKPQYPGRRSADYHSKGSRQEEEGHNLEEQNSQRYPRNAYGDVSYEQQPDAAHEKFPKQPREHRKNTRRYDEGYADDAQQNKLKKPTTEDVGVDELRRYALENTALEDASLENVFKAAKSKNAEGLISKQKKKNHARQKAQEWQEAPTIRDKAPSPTALQETDTSKKSKALIDKNDEVVGRSENIPLGDNTNKSVPRNITFALPIANKTMKVVRHFDRSAKQKMQGILLKTSKDSQVVAARGGTVLFAGAQATAGAAIQGRAPGMKNLQSAKSFLVVLQHDHGFVTAYGMLPNALVAKGQRVKAGAPLSKLQKNTSFYFEMRHEGQPINPLSYLR